MADATVLKIIFIFVFFFLALISGIFPAKSTRCNSNQNLLSVANAFSGGVFLAIAMLHIMPEAIGDYYEIKEDEGYEREEVFPLPYLIFFSGYTFILLIDRVMFDSHALFDDDDHEHGHGHDDVADPAERKLISIAKKSILATQAALTSNDPALIKKSLAL